MANGRLHICYWNIVPPYRNRADINERHCILHQQVGALRHQTSFSHMGQIYLPLIRRGEYSYNYAVLSRSTKIVAVLSRSTKIVAMLLDKGAVAST